jgi:hypothetical protein
MIIKTPLGPDHYRYRETAEEEGVMLTCERYVVVQETPKGYWVVRDYYIGGYWGPATIKNVRKFVLKDSLRRFCYPTPKEALGSFLARKKKHMRHINYALALAETSLAKAAELILAETYPTEEINCGRPDYFDNLNFADC